MKTSNLTQHKDMAKLKKVLEKTIIKQSSKEAKKVDMR
jgi:hypothetical protein